MVRTITITIAAWLVVLLIGLAGCAALTGPYREYNIRFESADEPVLSASPSDEELINATAWLIHHKLELPFPPTIKAYVYVNEATLVDGLINVAGDGRDEAGVPSGRVGIVARPKF